MTTADVPLSKPARRRSFWGWLILIPLWIVLLIATLWAFGALWYDAPSKLPAIVFGMAALLVLLWGRGAWRKLGLLTLGFVGVVTWWFSLRPSNDRSWQPDVGEAPWAEIVGDRVTLHNVRNCEYRTETDYTPHWETRTVDLNDLTGLDLAINYWGSEWMAHPIASFQFKNAPAVCFSIETRKETGESYSAIGGLYRQYELVYVCADERDVLRVRTNYRKGEDVYLYRLAGSPEAARQRFLEYIEAMNVLHDKARWYNAVTTNCTTGIRNQRAAAKRTPWDWRILVNGYGDQMMYEHGLLAGGLPFPELKKQARINEAAKTADADPNFSQRIRAGRAGFESTASSQPSPPPSKPL